MTKIKIKHLKSKMSWYNTRLTTIGLYEEAGNERLTDPDNEFKKSYFVLLGMLSSLLSLLQEKGIIDDNENVKMPNFDIDDVKEKFDDDSHNCSGEPPF